MGKRSSSPKNKGARAFRFPALRDLRDETPPGRQLGVDQGHRGRKMSLIPICSAPASPSQASLDPREATCPFSRPTKDILMKEGKIARSDFGDPPAFFYLFFRISLIVRLSCGFGDRKLTLLTRYYGFFRDMGETVTGRNRFCACLSVHFGRMECTYSVKKSL
jgi:hypothetical protein